MGLLSFFRRFKGIGQELRWSGPPLDPLTLAVPEQTIQPEWRFLFMTRILDVKGALEARGYPIHAEGNAVLSVEDPLLEGNTGTYRLEAGDGAVRVTRLSDEEAGTSFSIGALAAMYTGYATPWAAARSGLVDPAHPALPLLWELFAGSTPWTPDFF
jgi:predicted acetyltransferase